MKFTFREVIDSDIEEICHFPQSEIELYYMFPITDYPLTKSILVEHLKNRYHSTVFLYDNRICGFANFYGVEKDKQCALGNLVVSPEFRNKGVGQFIIETMELEAQRLYNIKELHIACINENTAGLLLYEKLGYTPFEMSRRLAKDEKIRLMITMKKIFKD